MCSSISPTAFVTNMVERLSTAYTSFLECKGPLEVFISGFHGTYLIWAVMSLGSFVLGVALSPMVLPAALTAVCWKMGMALTEEGDRIRSWVGWLISGLSQPINDQIAKLPQKSQLYRDVSRVFSTLGTYLMSKNWVKLEGGLDKMQVVQETLMIFASASLLRCNIQFVSAQLSTVCTLTFPILFNSYLFWGVWSVTTLLCVARISHDVVVGFFSRVKEGVANFVEIKEKWKNFITTVEGRLQTVTRDTITALDKRLLRAAESVMNGMNALEGRLVRGCFRVLGKVFSQTGMVVAQVAEFFNQRAERLRAAEATLVKNMQS